MYCVNGNSSWYINCRPLFGGCPLLGVSVIGGSTVLIYGKKQTNKKQSCPVRSKGCPIIRGVRSSIIHSSSASSTSSTGSASSTSSTCILVALVVQVALVAQVYQ